MKYIRKLLIITITFIIFLDSLAYAKPTTVGESILVIERKTNSIIYSKEPDKRMYPASTTKMLTALVTLDYFNKDETITTGDEVNKIPPNSSVANVGSGETLTIENILTGLLISSGNELACVLALNVAQRKEGKADIAYEDAEKIFAELMNEKAKSLGATNSNFINPHGYHDSNHYSTARDLYIIANALLENETLKNIVKIERFRQDGADKSSNPGKVIKSYDWTNSNRLLSSTAYKYEYATGIKTGSTDEAGKCLVASAEKEGKELIAVILNSDEAGRWNDAKALFEYGFNEFRVTSLQKKGEILGKVPVLDNNFKASTNIDIIAENDIESYIPSDNLYTIDKEITYYNDVNIAANGQPARLKLPLKAGQAIGTISYKIGEDVIYQSQIKAPSDININLASDDNSSAYQKALKQINTKKLIKYILRILIVMVVIVIVLLIIRIINIRIRKRRRRMKMRKRRRRNSYR